jgi:TRAP-type uncharacterized transport system substrate-binding protein
MKVFRSEDRRLALHAALGMALSLGVATPGMAQGVGERANRGVVEIITGGIQSTGAAMSEDLADVLDDGATRRVVPVIGKGSLQDVVDLKSLRGIDLGIVQTDALDFVKTQHLLPGIENAVSYIAKLSSEEFHLLARADIKSVADLAGKRVNFGAPTEGTAITAPRLFELLHVKVEPTAYNPALALEKLKNGEIAAMAYVVGKPAPFFAVLSGSGGLHLIGLPIRPEITAAYVPARLSAEDYPGLLPAHTAVDTVAVGSVLIAANLAPDSERYRNVANFVEVFFTQFPRLLEAPHHPKWNEVNLAAELPHWRRFPAAENWIKRNGGTPVALNEDQMRDIFAKFLDERSRASGATALSGEQKTQLFDQFRRWQGEHLR